MLNEKIKLINTKESLIEERLDKNNLNKRKANNVLEDLTNNKEYGKKHLINHNQTYSSHVEHFIESRDAFSPTAWIRLEQNGVIYGPMRAFLDTGAQPSVIASILYRMMKVNVSPAAYTVVGIDE